MHVIDWEEPGTVPVQHGGFEGDCIKRHLDLTELHGEREFLRQGFLVDVDGDGTPELITRTMNANRARAVRLTDGSTVWVSPDIAPPPHESSQVSQMDVGNLDEDGIPEVVLTSYDGDVICIDTQTGEAKWHRRLDWYINNPRIMIQRVTPGHGRNVCFTVGHDVDFIATKHARPRINMVRQPSLLVLDHEGNDALLIPEYAAHNGNGHNTWLYDIDDDGCCEIIASGDNRVIVFNNRGERLFELPCKPEGSDGNAHPDALLAVNWDPARPGKEILYLNGIDGLVMADCRGQVLFDETYPREVASHLQEIGVVDRPDGLGLIAENIRSADSKLLYMNHDFEIEWAAQMAGDMTGAMLYDWDGDGEDEIVTGSIGYNVLNPVAPERASLQVMKQDGTPLYWHLWNGASLRPILDRGDVDGDGREESIVSVGAHGGPGGRFSLREGSHEHVLVMAGT